MVCWQWWSKNYLLDRPRFSRFNPGLRSVRILWKHKLSFCHGWGVFLLQFCWHSGSATDRRHGSAQTNLRVVLLPAQQVESSLFQQLSMPIESLSRYWKRSLKTLQPSKKPMFNYKWSFTGIVGRADRKRAIRASRFISVSIHPLWSRRWGKVDQLVLVEKTLVGRISSVDQRVSQVKLLSDSGVAAIVAETNNGQRELS